MNQSEAEREAMLLSPLASLLAQRLSAEHGNDFFGQAEAIEFDRDWHTAIMLGRADDGVALAFDPGVLDAGADERLEIAQAVTEFDEPS